MDYLVHSNQAMAMDIVLVLCWFCLELEWIRIFVAENISNAATLIH